MGFAGIFKGLLGGDPVKSIADIISQFHMSPEDKALLDQDCLAMGNLAYGSWIVFALNSWIGRPNGLL